MYTLSGYGHMMADQVRMGAYRAALGEVVRPDSVVVDLGAGPGILSFIALQLGARQVYAIDPSESLEVARQIAQANGFQDRIRFYKAPAEAVELPEQADVIVSDLRGVLPVFPGNFSAVAYARERFLNPGGSLIPKRDTLCVALADDPEAYADIAGVWKCGDLDLSAGNRRAVNNWGKHRVPAERLLSEPARWAAVDYYTVHGNACAGAARIEATRSGTVYGLSVWFDAELIDGVGFSNAATHPEAIYGQAFFPLEKPVRLGIGDLVEVQLRADLVGDSYMWSWNTSVYSAQGERRANFRQSTFHSAPLTKEHLRKRADTFAPQLSHDGIVDRAILGLFESGLSLREIASKITNQFPSDFRDWKAALDRVAALSARYSD